MNDPAQHPFIKMSDSEHLRLEDPALDIRGLDAYDVDGHEIGSVLNLYIDEAEGKVRFLDVGKKGFLGIGEQHFLIPKEAVADVKDDRVTIAQGLEKIRSSPPFLADAVPLADYQRQLYDYYGYPDPRGSRS